MEFQEINEIQLKALANIPYVFNGVKLLPINVKTIAERGYEDFNYQIGTILLTKEKVFQSEIPKKFKDLELLELAILEKDLGFIKYYIDAFNYFLVDPIEWDFLDKTGVLVLHSHPNLALNEFPKLAQIIKIQHAIVSKEDGDDFNVISEGAKKLKARILAKRKKVEELKTNNGKDSLTFSDLVSIVSSNANGINVLNVWDLNYFQFNDQFNRMKMINEYETNIQALLHGASSDKIELRHWMTKIVE